MSHAQSLPAATPIFLPQSPVSVMGPISGTLTAPISITGGVANAGGGGPNRVVVSMAPPHSMNQGPSISLPPTLMSGGTPYQVNTTAASAPFTIPGMNHASLGGPMATQILTAVKSEPARNPDYTLDPDVESYVSIKTDPADPSNKLKYTCNACQFSPKQLNLLVEHINAVHLNRKNLQCTFCSFKTSRKKSLTAHINDIHLRGSNKKGSRKGAGGFSKQGGLLNNTATSIQEVLANANVFQCRHCHFASKKESEYKGHMLIVHRLTEAVEMPDDPHDPKAINSEQLIAYDNSFEHGYCCSVCKYSPTSMRYLRDHIRKVHLSKQIKCPYCELKTKRKADLIKHIRRLHPESIEVAGGGSGGGGVSNLTMTSGGMVSMATSQPIQGQTVTIVQAPSQTVTIPNAQLPQIPIQLPTQPLKLQGTHMMSQQHAPNSQQLTNDTLLNAALKSEIPMTPITLHLQYPSLQPMVQMPQQPVVQQQPVQISLPTIDTSAILNSYTSAGPTGVNTTNVTISNAQPVSQLAPPTTAYKKGSHQAFDPNTKVDDLIVHNSAYPFGMGCSVCNYAPQTLRYLRDHIRKVHLSKLFPCTYCDLKTKRKADLKRHIQRIHEDPKRQQQQQQQQQQLQPQQQNIIVKQEDFIPH